MQQKNQQRASKSSSELSYQKSWHYNMYSLSSHPSQHYQYNSNTIQSNNLAILPNNSNYCSFKISNQSMQQSFQIIIKSIINKKHVYTNSLSSKPILSILFKCNAIQQDLVVSPNNIITVSFFKISNQ